MSALANEGVALVKANKYSEGIEKLTQALKSQKAPMWLIERSKAYLRTNEFELALHDAETALSIAFSRANRDLMIEAQIRRAVTLFRMGRFADTDICAFWAIRLLDGAKASEDDGQQNKVDDNGDYTIALKEVQDTNTLETQAKKEAGIQSAMASGRSKDTTNRNLAFSWRINALQGLEKLQPGASGRKVNIVKYPKPSDMPPAKAAKVETEKVTELDNYDEPEEETSKPKIPQFILDPLLPKVETAWGWQQVWNHFQAEQKKHDIRTDWYETDTNVNVSLFVKNVPKDSVKVESQDQSVTISPIASSPTESYTLNLHGKIRPEGTTYTVKSMKIELVLKKEVPGKWRLLRDSAVDSFLSNEAGFSQFCTDAGFEPSAFSLDTYGDDLDSWYRDTYKKLASKRSATKHSPTSRPVTSVADAKQVEQTTLAREPPPLASAPAYPTSSKSGPKNWDAMDLDADEEKEADVDDFFKKLYKDADPDTRRAMMKSYVESNGTSLSTSWSEASKKNYKTDPPEGAVAKKWDD